MTTESNIFLQPPCCDFSLWIRAFRTLYYLLIVDIFVYGLLVPLLATVISGYLAYFTSASLEWEILILVLVTFILMYLILQVSGEATYWKYLFGFNPFFKTLLQIRDAVNAAIVLGIIYYSANMIERHVNRGQSIKKPALSQGICFYLVRYVLELFHLDLFFLEKMGFKPHSLGASAQEDSDEKLALYMTAMLTAGVAKMLYYNTLFSYRHAMETFLSLKPTFEEEDRTNENECHEERPCGLDHPATCVWACGSESNTCERLRARLSQDSTGIE